MQLLEEYKELIERDAHEILRLWKYAQMFLYLLSAISGYICSFLFYVLKEHIFGGNCPFWATSSLMLNQESGPDCILNSCTTISNWWRYIIIDYPDDILCEVYLMTCFLSCLFGIVWFTLFLMCGKGGHYVSIYEGPWRIVVPAMFFNFVFVIICMFAHYNLGEGYEAFQESIIDVSSEIYNIYEIVADVRYFLL
ncbi:unnamed protein product [Xylocopa violacea]|uniref:Uncharacterized protein n=1 Tax=Xylocopa violacea TaxID=135666 RepID=A0ABP1P8J9_XYLVO